MQKIIGDGGKYRYRENIVIRRFVIRRVDCIWTQRQRDRQDWASRRKGIIK